MCRFRRANTQRGDFGIQMFFQGRPNSLILSNYFSFFSSFVSFSWNCCRKVSVSFGIFPDSSVRRFVCDFKDILSGKTECVKCSTYI